MTIEIWAEKYRPEKLSEVINQKHVVERVKAFVKEKNIPHMLFAGPAGTGKCIEKETPIILGNGGIKPISDIKKGDCVLSLIENGCISPKKVNVVIKRKDKAIKIETKLGNEVEVTKEHPFLVLENGLPRWKKASQIKKNDFVATPINLSINNFFDKKLDLVLDDFWAKLKHKIKVPIFELFQGTFREILKLLYNENALSLNAIVKKLQLKRQTVAWCVKKLIESKILGKYNNKLRIIKKDVETKIVPLKLKKSMKDVVKIAYRGKYHKFSVWITSFDLTKEFCEWLGYVLSEGTIKNSEIIFNNKNPILLKRFKFLTRKIFKISPERHTYGLTIRKASTITKILQNLFDIPIDNLKKSYKIKVPNVLFQLPRYRISRFIRAYLDGDGFVGHNGIELYSNSKRILLGIKIMLLRFSIVSRLSHRLIKGEQRYRLTISGGENILNFKKSIGSLIWKFVVLKESTNKDIMEINPKMIQIVLNAFGISHEDILSKHEIEYVFHRRRASRVKVQKIYRKICIIARNKLSRLIEIYNLFQFTKFKLKNLEKFNKIFDSILEEIKPARIRKFLENETKIRYDRLLEYSQKKREPNLKNILRILKGLSAIKNESFYKEFHSNILFLLSLRRSILEVLNILRISYNDIELILNVPTVSVNYYLNNNSLTLNSLDKSLKILNLLESIIETRIFDDALIDILEILEFLSRAEIFWDRVTKVDETGIKTVCDLSIEGTHNFIGGYGPVILHNTTVALTIAHELYGKEWRTNVLETNASDARGIDVIRGQVKNFARTKSIGDVPFRIIILDEADNLTTDAQQALRRTMETFTSVSRFILIGNYSSRIIEPLQSRTAVFRFKALTEDDIKKFIKRIVDGEKLKITDDAISAIVYLSEGDGRRVANLLQASAALKERITEDTVYDVASRAKPADVKEMLEFALKGKFNEARRKLQELLLRQGLSGNDIISEIHRQIYSLDNLSEETKVQLIEKCGEYEFRISEGGNELIQLEALLANFLLFSKK